MRPALLLVCVGLLWASPWARAQGTVKFPRDDVEINFEFGDKAPQFDPAKCPRAGKFSTAKCTTFYFKCTKAGEAAARVTCEPGFMYNPYKGGCFQWSADLLCPFVCPMPGKFNTTACARSYFKCDIAGAAPGKVDCPPGMLYNPSKGTCLPSTQVPKCPFACPAAGNFNLTACAKSYYKCAGPSTPTVKITCDHDKLYIPSKGKCMPDSTVKKECPDGGIGGSPVACPGVLGLRCKTCESETVGVEILVICTSCQPGWAGTDTMCKVQSLGCSNTASDGVLALHNKYRKAHKSPTLKWNADVAARAQNYANGCVYAHSPRETRAGDGENIYYSWGYDYPHEGNDACESATLSFYQEVSSYKFSDPGQSRDDGMIGHFTQVVWENSAEVGCGYAKCLDFDYVVCQYRSYGNVILNGGWTEFSDNVVRTACQIRTKDDWCNTCSKGANGKCTSCFTRAYDAGAVGDQIELDAVTKKCVSNCVTGDPNGMCTMDGVFVRCKKGWGMDAAKKCTVLVCGDKYNSSCTACNLETCTGCKAGFRLREDLMGCERAPGVKPRRGL